MTINTSFSPEFAIQIIGVNGHAIPIACFGRIPGGVITMHTHAGGSELFSLMQRVMPGLFNLLG